MAVSFNVSDVSIPLCSANLHFPPRLLRNTKDLDQWKQVIPKGCATQEPTRIKSTPLFLQLWGAPVPPPSVCSPGAFREKVLKLVSMPQFQLMMLTITLIDVISLATDHYQAGQGLKDAIKYIGITCTGFFIAEVCLKLVGFGIRAYFRDRLLPIHPCCRELKRGPWRSEVYLLPKSTCRGIQEILKRAAVMGHHLKQFSSPMQLNAAGRVFLVGMLSHTFASVSHTFHWSGTPSGTCTGVYKDEDKCLVVRARG